MRDEWIPALSLHCDVETIENDFDLDAVCDVVEPDFIIFEMVSWTRPNLPLVTNPRAHPAIPRAAILNGDPHESLLPVLFHLLARCEVETLFGFGLHHHQHIPELAGVECYSLPIFVDGSVFRDYGLEKVIPVSIFGAHMVPTFYPWRTQVVSEIQRLFPTLVYPHPGYRKDERNPFAVRGTDYARLLNQSRFSIADTTRLDYVVRKHLEIPGAGSVLLAPDSAALKDYGFVDMANCILGAPQEIYGKILAVSRDEGLAEAIRQNGLALVHSRYTRENWTPILDWFECLKACGPGQVVRQSHPMGRFRAVAAAPGRSAVGGTIRESPLSGVLRQARDALLQGRDLDRSHAALEEVSTWSSNIAEPAFLMGLHALLSGNPVDAAVAISRRAEDLRNFDLLLGRLDPVELAWLLLIAHLIEHVPLVEAMQEQARETRHIAVRRMLWLLDPDAPAGPDLDRRLAGDQISVRWLGQENFGDWCDLVERILDANGASRIKASMLRRLQRKRSLEPGVLRRA